MRGIFFLVFFISLITRAQSPVGNDAQIDLALMDHGTGMFRSFDNRYKGLEGFPTLFKHYQSGKIKMSTGKVFMVDSVNLDIVSNELLVKRNNIETIVNKKMVDEFEIGNSKYVRLEDQIGEISFYVFLLNGKYKLLRRDIKNLVEPSNNGAYSNGSLSARFDESRRYYILFDGGLIEVRSKKQVAMLLPEHTKKVDQYMRESNFTIKKEENLLNLIRYINGL